MDRTYRGTINAALGSVFVIGLGLTAYLIADSWGGLYWLFDCVAGTAVAVLALLRGPRRRWPVLAGLAVAAAAVVVARLPDLPQEPGPVAALALAVLIGSAVRGLPAGHAAAVAGGGFVVVAGTWLSARPEAGGFTVVTIVNMVAWLAAVALGIGLRAARTVS